MLMVTFFTGGVVLEPQKVFAAFGDPIQWGSSGKNVRELQTNLTNLGFDTYGIDGIFGTNTYTAVQSFQKASGIKADGIVGPVTANVLNEQIYSYITHVVQWGDTLSKLAFHYGTTVNNIMQANNLRSYIIYAGDTLRIPTNETPGNLSWSGMRSTELADWWTVADKVFARGEVATVTDVDTGISYRVKRKGGTNHADCEPLTAEDAAKMKKARGGYWSWNRRAIIVTVDGRNLAASQNGMPHGFQNIYNNNFDGHFCIHFLNSRTHGTNRVDAAHQTMVKKAATARL